MKNRPFIGVTLTACLFMFGCQQVNDLVNGKTVTNSNTTANTNANSNVNTSQTLKDDLVGTWIGVDDPKNKVTFTADEMTTVENGQETKLKYTRLSDDEIEVIIDGKTRKAKTTLEGEVLTITGADEAVKFKRESANAADNRAANTNTQASNTVAPKEEVPLTPDTFKNRLMGYWDDENGDKTIFGFSVVQLPHSGAVPYKIVVNENTVEIQAEKWGWAATKATFEDNGNTLILTKDNGQVIKLKRLNPKW